MASSNLKKFTNPGFLRSLKFSNLIKLLRKFDGYFSGVVHFQYDNIEQDKFDFDGLAAILIDQMMVGDYSELFNAFGLIGAMGTDSREDVLREYIDAQPYKDEVTDDTAVADLALLVYLHAPEVLNDIDIEFNATKKKSFAMRATRRNMSDLVITHQHIVAFEEELNKIFVTRHRGNTAKVYTPSKEGDEYYFIIRHGDSFKRQGTVSQGKESRTLAFQPESFNLLVLNTKTGELRICVPAQPKWMEEGYALTLGKALFNDFAAFDEKRCNNLERIKELGEKVLIYNGAADVRKISLIGLTFWSTPECHMKETLDASNDALFQDFKMLDRDIAGIGTIFEARFVVQIGDKERTVVIKNNNRSGYDYDDFGIVVDEWLRSVGIIPSVHALEVAA